MIKEILQKLWRDKNNRNIGSRLVDEALVQIETEFAKRKEEWKKELLGKIDKTEDKDGLWRSEFQYLLNNKILSRDEIAELFGQIKSILNNQFSQIKQIIEEA
jgi:hypothetical protein